MSCCGTCKQGLLGFRPGSLAPGYGRGSASVRKQQVVAFFPSVEEEVVVPLRPFGPLRLVERLPPPMRVPPDRHRNDDGLQAQASDLEREVDVCVAVPLELLGEKPSFQQP